MTTNSSVRLHGERCKTGSPSAPAERTEQFNPYGLHSIHVPLGLVRNRNVSWGAKCLYGRLALFRGRKPAGFCSPRRETLADEMNVPVDTVDRWLAELVKHRLVERKRRRRDTAECFFLPHPCLLGSAILRTQDRQRDSADMPNQTDSQDSSTVRNQGAVPDSVSSSTRFGVFASRDSASLRSPYKEENIHHQNVHENLQKSDPRKSGDDEKHSLDCAPAEEVRNIFRRKTGEELSPDVERRIWETVELRGVTREFFVGELRQHVPNTWMNPAGFLTNFARKIRSVSTPDSMPATAPEPPKDAKGRCSSCGGTGYALWDVNLTGRQYCACSLGRDLKRVDECRAKERLAATEAARPEKGPMQGDPACAGGGR